METTQANRIQESILNKAEKKALVWLAERLPAWISSDFLTAIGFIGALVIAAGYCLTPLSLNFLWLASFGFIINWYGDSLDGTVARVRKKQRPIYGFYIDHTIDCINECLMFIGAGLSSLMHLNFALLLLIAYLLLTINVSVNAHLKKEFKLTYAKLGPTEFRIVAIIINTLFIFVRPLREFSIDVSMCGQTFNMQTLDIIAVVIFVLLMVFYMVTIFNDAKGYSKVDPKK